MTDLLKLVEIFDTNIAFPRPINEPYWTLLDLKEITTLRDGIKALLAENEELKKAIDRRDYKIEVLTNHNCQLMEESPNAEGRKT